MNAMNTPVRAPLDDDLAEDLHRAVSLLEDWLLHASPETLDELADFAYGPSHQRPQPAPVDHRPARRNRRPAASRTPARARRDEDHGADQRTAGTYFVVQA
jgi:hypothetical protein